MTADPLDRIAAALERLAPAPRPKPDFAASDAFEIGRASCRERVLMPV